MKKEKEIMFFAKAKMNALSRLLESQEIQEKYPELSGDNVEIEWGKFRLNIDNFTLNYYETQADLLIIPLKKCGKNLNLFKLAIEEICREKKLRLYVTDAYPADEYHEELDETDEDYCLRLCSPSMNRNIQTLRLMTYIEEEKINSLIAKINHVGDKSLQKNVGNLKQLHNLGVEIIVNLSYSRDEVTGIIKTIKDREMVIMINYRPELITISTIRFEDPWLINSIEGTTPINHMWNNGVELQKQIS